MTPPEVFYAISADNLKAIPFGLVHIGVINTTDPSYRTIEIKHNYDPYEKGTTFNFLAWTQPVPFSVPLFAHESKSDKGLYITFDGEPPLESSPLESSPQEWDKDQFPIYILKNKKNFTEYMDRCLPSGKGTSLSDCFRITKKPKTLLDLLSNVPLPQSKIESPSFSFWVVVMVVMVVMAILLALSICISIFIS